MNDNCIFLCNNKNKICDVYGKELMCRLSADAHIYSKDEILNNSTFAKVEYVFSTWGMPKFTEAEINAHLPSLKAVFYAAGSVQAFAKEFLNCGVKVFSAWRANAIPVAEFTLSQILLASKGYFPLCRKQSMGDLVGASRAKNSYQGNFNTPVGIIGAGMIGKKVIELLQPFSIDLYAYDAFLSADEISALGAKKVSLEELFERCLVVSNHLANNADTVGMLNYELFSRLMPFATFINTGRGAQVIEDELVRSLTERPDITALLDVTYPEPPCEGHPFYRLENCFLTPHIAGSMGNEVKRMGEYMLVAYQKTVLGEKNDCEVTLDMLSTMA